MSNTKNQIEVLKKIAVDMGTAVTDFQDSFHSNDDLERFLGKLAAANSATAVVLAEHIQEVAANDNR